MSPSRADSSSTSGAGSSRAGHSGSSRAGDSDSSRTGGTGSSHTEQGGSSRAEQRRRTEQRILGEARRLFGERGYERTTIRAIAGAAGVDGGLVMHYFGSKQELFQRVAQIDADELIGDDPAEALLASLATRLTAEPAASLAVLRSLLTNEDAAATYRSAVQAHLDRVTAAIPSPDAALRAGLLTAITHGVIIERYLLRLGPVAAADAEEIIALLRPCFQALAG